MRIINQSFVLLAIIAAFLLPVAHAEKAKGKYDDVVAKMLKRCNGYKDVIRKQMANAPFAKDKKFFEGNVELRYYAECECLPEKFKNIDLSSLTDKQFDALSKQSGFECAGSGLKKHWLSLCDGFIRNEIKDKDKQVKACQCIDPVMQKVDDKDVLVTFSAISKDASNPAGKELKACVDKFK